MNYWVFIFTFISALSLSCQAHAAPALHELSSADQAKVLNGEQVLVTKNFEKFSDGPWPEMTVYQWLKATPEESVAVFSDYDRQKAYIPDLIESKVLKRDKTFSDIEYTLGLPLGLGKEVYTAHDVLTSYDEGKSYKVSWLLDPTPTIKHSEGSIRFEPMEVTDNKGVVTSGTLIVYRNYIYSLRMGARFFIKQAKDKVAHTVTQIGHRIAQAKKDRENGDSLLNAQIQALRDALEPKKEEVSGICTKFTGIEFQSFMPGF